MNGFIEWLEGLNEKDTKVRAVLRRSLAFDPGKFAQAYPYVEPFLKGEDNFWRREMFYLVAGLWAMHWQEGRIGAHMPIGKACAAFDSEKRQKMSLDDRRKTTSTEKRFVTLLDADADHDQLPHRLRQMVALLKDYNLDFAAMLWDADKKTGLMNWNDDQKRTQNAWARDFYRNLNNETATEYQNEKEISE